MDKHSSVLPVQRVEREFTGFRLLKRIDENNTPPARLKRIWDHVLTCEESFDDFTRGKVEYFLAQFQNPDVEFYAVGDDGLVVLSGITPRGACDVHYMTWNRELGLAAQKPIACEVMDYVFYDRKVHHLVGYIPSNNSAAIRFAMGVGMKFEGEIRENFLFHGKYFATHIYGMLDREYVITRTRLT